jgi:hypothetical protein
MVSVLNLSLYALITLKTVDLETPNSLQIDLRLTKIGAFFSVVLFIIIILLV